MPCPGWYLCVVTWGRDHDGEQGTRVMEGEVDGSLRTPRRPKS